MLGGTFNPPHRGHLALALHARDELGLGRLLLMPAHTAPFKVAGAGGAGGADPGPRHRLRMTELAATGAGGISVCPMEIERGGVSYTVDTLRALHAIYPQAELTLIVGADVASTLGSWHEAPALLELAEVAVAARPGAQRGSLPPGVRARPLQMPTIDVSSSLVRERVAAGQPVEELVGPAVAAYIAEHGLYRSPVREAPA